MPQYMLKLPHGANTRTITANGTQPNQRFRKNFTKTKNPNPIFENPQFLNPNLNFYIISENMKKTFRKTYLEVILQRFFLENEEV